MFENICTAEQLVIEMYLVFSLLLDKAATEWDLLNAGFFISGSPFLLTSGTLFWAVFETGSLFSEVILLDLCCICLTEVPGNFILQVPALPVWIIFAESLSDVTSCPGKPFCCTTLTIFGCSHCLLVFLILSAVSILLRRAWLTFESVGVCFMSDILYCSVGYIEKRKTEYEPHYEKICLQGFQPGKTQTGLLS